MVRSHGHTINRVVTTEYRAWRGMRDRCYNAKNKEYHCYGGRGIKVCDRWVNSFENFLSDMGLKPDPKYSIDRFPDTNGDYEPSNCRWATSIEQQRNKTTNKWITCNGETKTQSEWAVFLGVKNNMLHHYLKTFTIDEIVKMVNNGGIIDKRSAPYCKEYYKVRPKGMLGKFNIHPNVRMVNQYDKDGVFIKQFNSISEVKRLTGIVINAALSGRMKTAGKYKWEYA